MNRWGWLIAIYLFMGGVGAGAFLSSFAAEKGWLGKSPGLTKIGYIISAPIVGLGTFLLIFDLGQGLKKPWLLIGLLSNPHSVMTWGTGILSFFIVVGLLHAFLIWRKKSIPKLLNYVGCILSIAVVSYTGLLISVVKAIPFWNSYIVPVLFIISALSTGLSANAILAHFFAKGKTDEKPVCRTHLILVAAEIIVLTILFTVLLSGLKGPAAEQSGALIVYDSFALVFWLILVCFGLAGPLIMYAYNVRRSHKPVDLVVNGQAVAVSSHRVPSNLICLCDAAVLVGGLALRCLFIFAAVPIWNGTLL